MNTPAATAAGTPREIGRSITRAWIAYFVVITLIGIVLNLMLSGVYGLVVGSMMGSPMLMRIGFIFIGILVNAPVSFLAFQWAVRGKVLPAIIDWNAGGAPAN